MDGSEPNERPQPLAMSQGGNPWGGDAPEPGKGDGKDGGKPKGKDDDAASPAEGEPRNPWLTPDDDQRPRRSANIDDILRSRVGAGAAGLGALRRGWMGLALLGAVTALLLSSSVHMLDRDERGLVLTMGRYSHAIGPGLQFTLPWPLQSVLRQPVGKELTSPVPEKGGETLMPTRDGELIDVQFQVRWKISDLKSFAFNLPDGEAAIRRLADAQVRAAVAELPFGTVLGGRQQAQMQQRVIQRMQKVLDAWHSGVTITGVEVLRVAPPSQVGETFKKVADAGENARRNRERAEAWRASQVSAAYKEAAEFERVYAQYKIAPGVTRQRLYYETLERVIANNSVVLGGTAPAASAPAPAAVPLPSPEPQPEGK